jgi:RNA polymerase-binding transcription factor DksA
MAQQTKGSKRTDLDFDHFRQLLMAEKEQAEAVIGGTQSQGEPDTMNQAGTDRAELSSQDENHPADAATELQLREQDMALIDNARSLLQQVNRALEKLDEGSYGISDESGEPIPVERLEAIPYATRTVQEQEMVEVL